jgi:pyruvate kinase
MLESMVSQPRPTRAEATDVATAVLDGTDAIMLSEETAQGRYPVEAVRIMARLAERAERSLDHGRFLNPGRAEAGISSAVARAACALAGEVGVSAILVPTRGGSTPLQIATRRPSQPIVALTHDPRVRRRLALTWGTVAISGPDARSGDEIIQRCVEAARAERLVASGDVVVVTGDVPLHASAGRHMIEVVSVP